MHMPDDPEPIDPLAALDGMTAADVPLHAYGFVEFEDRWDGEGPMPENVELGGARYPKLAQIHPRQWARVLAPLSRTVRQDTAYGSGMTAPEAMAAEALVATLPPPAQELARAAAERPTVPPAPPARPPTSVQVNVRLGAADHEALATAAAIVGIRPTTLARWLIVSGSRRVLRDHAEAYS